MRGRNRRELALPADLNEDLERGLSARDVSKREAFGAQNGWTDRFPQLKTRSNRQMQPHFCSLVLALSEDGLGKCLPGIAGKLEKLSRLDNSRGRRRLLKNFDFRCDHL
jgi:hypothetical protein